LLDGCHFYFVGHSNIFVEGLHVIKVYQQSHYQAERVNQFLGRARKTARLFSHV